MTSFKVTFRNSTDAWFKADRIAITSDNRWFHFLTDGEVTARVNAEDVRIIEDDQTEPSA